MKIASKATSVRALILAVVAFIVVPSVSYAGALSELVELISRLGARGSSYETRHDPDNATTWWILFGIALVVGLIASASKNRKKSPPPQKATPTPTTPFHPTPDIIPAVPVRSTEPAEESQGSMNIHVTKNGEQLGPFPLQEINRRLSAGTFLTSDLAWHEGLSDWRSLSFIAGVTGHAPQVPPPPPPEKSRFGDKRWSGGAMTGIVIATVIFPIVGVVLGIIGLCGPAKRFQGVIVWLITIAAMLFWFLVQFSQ